MYLFSLLFILLTILGLFTQILAQQNNRFAAMKTGGAQQMLVWHSAVVAAARYTVGGVQVFNNPAPNPLPNIVWGGAAPCTVGLPPPPAPPPPPPPPPVPACLDANGFPNSLIALVPITASPTSIRLLPEGYDTNIAFNSIIFTPVGTTQRVALTYIGPSLAGAEQPLDPIGMTASQIFRQLKRSPLDPSLYGYLTNNLLMPSVPMSQTITGAYTVPANLLFNAATNPTGPLRPGALALFTPL